jgi:hypothetical protein
MNSSTIGTTNIDSLPISPQSGGGTQPVNNVRLDTFEKPPQYNPNNLNGNGSGAGAATSTATSTANNVVIDNAAQTLQQQRADDPAVMQRNMNQFVTGLQQASASGLLSLSARDIPQSQEHLARDQQMQPNYIPQQSGGSPDYINEYASQQSLEDIAQTQGLKERRAKRANDWYEELQVPILLAVLYFLFQLPAFRLRMLAFMPSLFQKDGNPNLTGYVVNSIFFGGLYLALKHGMRYFAL